MFVDIGTWCKIDLYGRSWIPCKGIEIFYDFLLYYRLLIVKAYVWHPVDHLGVLVDYNPSLQKREFFLWINFQQCKEVCFLSFFYHSVSVSLLLLQWWWFSEVNVLQCAFSSSTGYERLHVLSRAKQTWGWEMSKLIKALSWVPHGKVGVFLVKLW